MVLLKTNASKRCTWNDKWSSLIWVHTICPDLSVQNLRIVMVTVCIHVMIFREAWIKFVLLNEFLKVNRRHENSCYSSGKFQINSTGLTRVLWYSIIIYVICILDNCDKMQLSYMRRQDRLSVWTFTWAHKETVKVQMSMHIWVVSRTALLLAHTKIYGTEGSSSGKEQSDQSLHCALNR